jgi:hypothetical protein
LPATERRYGDILIHDGAQEGTRTSNGREYPVFDELGVWRVSQYSTFEVELVVPNQNAMESLQERCRESGLWVEDWGTVRILCEACSRGTPGEHACKDPSTGQSRFGFASRSEDRLRTVVQDWAEFEEGASLGRIALVVPGLND